MKKKTFLIIILISLFFLPILVQAEKTPKVSNDTKLFDYADLFSDSEEEKLKSKITDFIENYKHDLVIVTIDTILMG